MWIDKKLIISKKEFETFRDSHNMAEKYALDSDLEKVPAILIMLIDDCFIVKSEFVYLTDFETKNGS